MIYGRSAGVVQPRFSLDRVDVRAGIEHAVAALEPGGQLVEARELTGGVSANVFGLCIATPAGTTRRVVFRQHRSADFKGHAGGVTAKEFAVLAALHEKGFAVPEPYLLDDSGMVTAPYLVTEWIDGSTDVAADDLPGALEQMAQFLARLHSSEVDTPAPSGLEPIEDPRSAVVPFLPPTETGDRLRAALAGGGFASEPNRSVLLHGDYWPGNVMWKDGRLVAVIDWEDASLGDPLADLATARVELLCQYGPDAMESFTTRYLALLQDMARSVALDALPLWEVYVAASALATMHAWNLERAEEDRRRRRTQGFFDHAALELL